MAKKTFGGKRTWLGHAAFLMPPRTGFPLTIALESEELPKKSWVKVSQTRTLSTTRLKRRIGRISSEEIGLVIQGLNEIIAA